MHIQGLLWRSLLRAPARRSLPEVLRLHCPLLPALLLRLQILSSPRHMPPGMPLPTPVCSFRSCLHTHPPVRSFSPARSCRLPSAQADPSLRSGCSAPRRSQPGERSHWQAPPLQLRSLLPSPACSRLYRYSDPSLLPGHKPAAVLSCPPALSALLYLSHGSLSPTHNHLPILR